jgi:hypothetical protein
VSPLLSRIQIISQDGDLLKEEQKIKTQVAAYITLAVSRT